MIPVTCRNGEHFSIDPDAIERIETAHDTVVHMIDGSKYVVDVQLDDLILAVRDHRAAAVAARNRLLDDVATDDPADPQHGRRDRGERPMTILPDRDED